MYYDNKSTFYVRQYGPAVIITIISLVLIGTGVFIYLNATGIGNPLNNGTDIAQQQGKDADTNTPKEPITPTEPEEKDALVDEEKPVDTKPVEQPQEPTAPVVQTKYFETLPALQKSENVTVTAVSNNGGITVEKGTETIEIYLIGIDYQYANASVFDTIKNDLLNKQVTIAFDDERTIDNKNYAYIFSGTKAYNAELLRSGLVTLKTERKNIHLNTELSSAQAEARKNKQGVWNK